MNPKDFRQNAPGRVLRTSEGFWAYVPDPLPPKFSWSPQLVAALSDADRALGELAGLGRTIPNPHLMIKPLMRKEAVLSSRIEGTQASLSDLFTYEAGEPTLSRASSDDVREVHNYVRAMEYGLERLGSLPLSLRLVREIHGELMRGVRGEHKQPGEFRRSQNWIGPPGCTIDIAPYVPPPVAEMRDALAELESFLYEESVLPPLVRLGLVHYQFEAIHPFLDGNGRVGRVLITLLGCAWELLPHPLLYLSAYFESHRDTYYDLLMTVSKRGLWQEWLTFFLQGVAIEASDAATRMRHLQDLREEYQGKMQATRVPIRVLDVVDLLFSSPLITLGQVQSVLDIDYHAARRYVGKLVDEGILQPAGRRTRARVYAATEIVRAVEDPV